MKKEMSVFQVGVLLILALILCAVIAVGGYVAYSMTNQNSPVQAISTIPPTYTPYPTYTPLPLPTQTVEAVFIPTATNLPASPSTSQFPVQPVGEKIVRVNSWKLEVTEIYSDPGIDSSRQIVVLIVNATNEGSATDTFVATFTVLLRDSQGRSYEDDLTANFSAQSKYNTEYAVVNPGATVRVAIAYDVPASEKTFTLVRGDLVSSWSGDVSFTLP